jgi:hypothetical protein
VEIRIPEKTKKIPRIKNNTSLFKYNKMITPKIIEKITILGCLKFNVGFLGSLNIYQSYPQVVEIVHEVDS